METIAKCLKEVFYKGHHITKVEDVFGQVSVRIDNIAELDFASIADAKRVINGKAPKWFTDGYMWDKASKKVVKDPNAFRWEE